MLLCTSKVTEPEDYGKVLVEWEYECLKTSRFSSRIVWQDFIQNWKQICADHWGTLPNRLEYFMECVWQLCRT